MKALLGIFLLGCFGIAHSWKGKELVRFRRRVVDPTEKRIVCYYANWAVYRKGDSKFGPENIHPHLCTHILYAYASLEKDVGLVPFDPQQDIQLEGYAKFIELKKANPDLKLILSVGGSKQGSTTFSKIAGDPALRSQFAKNSLGYIKQFGFDGLDLVWKYPNFSEGSTSADKENYVQLVKELRGQFKEDYILSIAVPFLASLIEKGFNLQELSMYVDFMNVVSYDYHTATEPTVNHVAPLYTIPEDPFKDLNVDSTIKTYIKLGVDPQKLNMGIALYGLFYILEDAEVTDIGSPAEEEGSGSQERGSFVYNEFCKKIKEERWTVRHLNKSALGPYAYKDKRWVSYDDEDMITTKARYAADQNLGGLMFWTIDMDDFKMLCHSRAFPLIKAGREAFLAKPRTITSPALSTEVTVPTTQPPVTHHPATTRPPRVHLPITPRPTRPTTPRLTTPKTTHHRSDETVVGSSPYQPDQLADETQESTDWKTTTEPPNDKFPEIPGNKTFYSNRDIVFQNVKLWVNNHY